MARLTFPDEGSRMVFRTAASGRPLTSAAGASAVVYTDATATTLADIETTAGAAISGSSLNADAYSRLPLFLGPADGTDTLYVVVDGGPVSPMYARADDRIDAVKATADAAETPTAAQAKATAAQAAAIAAAATDAASRVSAEATTRAGADSAEATARASAVTAAIATAASDATTKANAAVVTAGTNAAGAYEAVGAVRRTAQLPGVIVADNAFGYGLTDNVSSTSQTARRNHTVAMDCTELRLAFGNFGAGGVSPVNDTDNPNPVTVSASLEIGGTIYRLTFGGRTSVTIDGGGLVWSDPLTVEVSAGQVIYSRTYVVGTSYYINQILTKSDGIDGKAAGDLTAPGSAAIAASNGFCYTPYAVLGVPTRGVATVPQVVAVGDSVISGVGDLNGMTGSNKNALDKQGGGWLVRGLTGRAGLINVARASDTATDFALLGGHARRARYLGNATHVVCGYGRNDVTLYSPSAVQAALLAVWTLIGRRGPKVYQTTITPVTTSTDGWMSAGSQTTASSEATRVTVNTWLRAGAPIDPTTKAAVAVGTSGALLAGDSGHPLARYGTGYIIEVTDLVETARNSGIWKSSGVRTVTDAVTTNGSIAVTSATGAFVTADVGADMWVQGAGTSGADLLGYVVSKSSTQLNCSNSAGASLSGATLKLGTSYTTDGIHPSSHGAAVAAAAIDLSKFT